MPGLLTLLKMPACLRAMSNLPQGATFQFTVPQRTEGAF